MNERVRNLSYDERATWGDCPICAASHGEWCNGSVGIALGIAFNADSFPEKGAHLGRVQSAPMRVREIPI